MRALLKKPGATPEIIEIENSLKAFQAAVGGFIETVTIAEDAAIVCNEEGRLFRLPYNCVFMGIDFVGPILIVGVDGDEFCDVPQDSIVWILSYRKERR